MAHTPLYTISFEESENDEDSEMAEQAVEQENSETEDNQIPEPHVHPPKAPRRRGGQRARGRPIRRRGRPAKRTLRSKTQLEQSNSSSNSSRSDENNEKDEKDKKDENSQNAQQNIDTRHEIQPNQQNSDYLGKNEYEEELHEKSLSSSSQEPLNSAQELQSNEQTPCSVLPSQQSQITSYQNSTFNPGPNPSFSSLKEPNTTLNPDAVDIQHFRPSQIFRLHRNRRGTLHPVTEFSLFEKDHLLFSAKAKSVYNAKVVIQLGAEVHLGSPSPDYVLTSDHGRNYHLHEKGKNGDILLEVSFQRNLEDGIRPRSITVESKKPPLKLVNMEPVFNSIKHTWQLDFGGKFVVKSHRNYVLINENQVVSVIVRKFAKDDLEIETYLPTFPVLYLMVMGIADYLCTLD